MRQALFQAWRQAVVETDVVICLGDVTVGPADPAIDAALAGLPGEKIPVAGNDDVGGRGKDYGFGAACPDARLRDGSAAPAHARAAHRGAGRRRERARAPARRAREGEGAQVEAPPERQLRADRLPAGAARRAGDGRRCAADRRRAAAADDGGHGGAGATAIVALRTAAAGPHRPPPAAPEVSAARPRPPGSWGTRRGWAARAARRTRRRSAGRRASRRSPGAGS